MSSSKTLYDYWTVESILYAPLFQRPLQKNSDEFLLRLEFLAVAKYDLFTSNVVCFKNVL